MLIMALLPQRRIAHGSAPSSRLKARFHVVASWRTPKDTHSRRAQTAELLGAGRCCAVFAWSKPRQALNARKNQWTDSHSSDGGSAVAKTVVRGTSRAAWRSTGPTGLCAARAADARAPKTAVTMLPRLDFHSSLRDAVLDGRKTATTRLVGELDSNTDVDGLRPGMRAAATCQGETFAELTMLSIEPVSYDAIDDKLARAEDCAMLRTQIITKELLSPGEADDGLPGHPVPLRR